MSDDVVIVPQDLSKRVVQVAEQHTSLRAAIAEERAAEAAVLDRLVAMMRPALAAVSSKPTVSHVTRWHGNVSTSSQEERAAWRGLRVRGEGPEHDHPRDNSGAYEGTDLFLRSDGTWCELEYSGQWSKWQGATSEWHAEERVLTSRQVADTYDLEAIVESMNVAVDKQLCGNAPKRAAAAAARAKKLSALAELLELL